MNPQSFQVSLTPSLAFLLKNKKSCGIPITFVKAGTTQRSSSEITPVDCCSAQQSAWTAQSTQMSQAWIIPSCSVRLSVWGLFLNCIPSINSTSLCIYIVRWHFLKNVLICRCLKTLPLEFYQDLINNNCLFKRIRNSNGNYKTTDCCPMEV